MSSGRVVVVGAHLQGVLVRAERVPAQGETILGWGYEEPLDGGKATSQAVAAARLGAPTALVCAFGEDASAERWRALLRGEGIDIAGCVTVPGDTDRSLMILPDSGIPAIVSVLDGNRALDRRAVLAAAPIIDGAAVVVCQLEATEEVALTAFGRAAVSGATRVLNPAPAQPLSPLLVDLCDVLVPNEHEAEHLVGASGGPRAAAARLAAWREGLAVVVTAGSAGAYVATRGDVFLVPGVPVTAVDTTGAGDCFVGALAAALARGETLDDAAAFAVRAAAMSVTQAGTVPSLPSAAELLAS